jgi:AbrB family looped-hinge helix DNA binding protein
LKQYQVTSKRQVTIPKYLAERKGIKPGDSVLFEETKEGIVLKRAAGQSRRQDREALRKTIEAFMMEDVPLIRKQLKRSRRALNENLSRHISS